MKKCKICGSTTHQSTSACPTCGATQFRDLPPSQTQSQTVLEPRIPQTSYPPPRTYPPPDPVRPPPVIPPPPREIQIPVPVIPEFNQTDTSRRAGVPGQTGIVVAASEARPERPEFNRFAPVLWLVAIPGYAALLTLFILGIALRFLRPLTFWLVTNILQRTPPDVPTYYYRLTDDQGQAFSMRIKGPFGGYIDKGDRVTILGMDRGGTTDASRVINHTDSSIITTQRARAERLTLIKIVLWIMVWIIIFSSIHK